MFLYINSYKDLRAWEWELTKWLNRPIANEYKAAAGLWNSYFMRGSCGVTRSIYRLDGFYQARIE